MRLLHQSWILAVRLEPTINATARLSWCRETKFWLYPNTAPKRQDRPPGLTLGFGRFLFPKGDPGDWTFFSRIQTNQRALPIETNVSFHQGRKCQRSVCFIQAGNESLRLVTTIAVYFAAIVGLCGRFPNCPRLNATYAFNRGYQKCPNSRVPKGDQ